MIGIRTKYNKLLDKHKETKAINAELRGCILKLGDMYKVDDHPIWERVADLLDRAKTF